MPIDPHAARIQLSKGMMSAVTKQRLYDVYSCRGLGGFADQVWRAICSSSREARTYTEQRDAGSLMGLFADRFRASSRRTVIGIRISAGGTTQKVPNVSSSCHRSSAASKRPTSVDRVASDNPSRSSISSRIRRSRRSKCPLMKMFNNGREVAMPSILLDRSLL